MVFTTTLFKLKSRNKTVCYIKSLDVLGLLKRSLTDSWTSPRQIPLTRGELVIQLHLRNTTHQRELQNLNLKAEDFGTNLKKEASNRVQKKIMRRSATVCLKGDYHNSRIKNYSLLVVNQN